MNWEYFDCSNFAEYICWETSQGDKFDLSKYNKKDLNTDELKWWEIILLWNKINLDNLNLKWLIHFWLHWIFEFDEEHVMIYIGNWLYISKASDEYWIIVWELWELKKLYNSNDALLLERK